MLRRNPLSTPFPYTTLFRSPDEFHAFHAMVETYCAWEFMHMRVEETEMMPLAERYLTDEDWASIDSAFLDHDEDRKSTRLNSSHLVISYAVFCLKKKTKSHI